MNGAGAAAPGGSVRRVVTGYSAEGKAIIASDTMVSPITVALMPGAEFIDVWGADQAPALPASGAKPPYASWFPPAGGFRVEEITIPPEGTPGPSPEDMPSAVAEIETKLPGLAGHLDPGHPGMHQTDTVDFVYVIDGRCVLELDSGIKAELDAGDIVVQNGTRHAWRVPYDRPCRLLSISIGARRMG